MSEIRILPCARKTSLSPSFMHQGANIEGMCIDIVIPYRGPVHGLFIPSQILANLEPNLAFLDLLLKDAERMENYNMAREL